MTDNTETVRTFIAIELSPAIRKEIEQILARVRNKPVTRHVRWTQPQKMHLTLQFLGDTPVGLLPEVEAALRGICPNHAPLDVRFGQPGCFPNVYNPRVLWIGIEEPTTPLKALQRAVVNAMGRLGFAPEKRSYTPHLTLGRVKRHASKEERRQLGQLVATAEIPAIPPMPVSSISFIRSQLLPNGARYTTLASVPLGDGREATSRSSA
ncbi:MAG: RNA 2',3'-cyclic phosphodiesterase [Chloroflexi bacterium]|nr:RNA 2',3'-cyclic phosphodiesterase [Chloroflexota bacterium]